MSNSDNGSGGNQRTTLIEEGTSFQGSFASQCPIVVKGRIEGDISGPSLTVSSTGSVAGTVKVGIIESEGELSGEFEADVIRLSGRVRDNTVIRARSLEVKLSPEKGMMQVIFGECALDVGDMPDKDEALRAAAAASTADATPEVTAPSGIEAAELGPSAAEAPAEVAVAPDDAVPVMADEAPSPSPQIERVERRNGGKGKGGPARTSTMPPPAH
jgi:cytoskeletal protein CcmA (bactofilin family)